MGYKSVIQDFTNANTTVFGALKDASERYQDAPAIGFFGKSFSYNELVIKTEDVAKALIEAGVKQGDAVTFMLPNCPQAVMVYYAINRVGAVANMIHTLSTPKNITFYLNKAHSKFIVTLDSLYSKVKEGCENADEPVKIIYTSISDEMPIVTKIGYKIKTAKTKPEPINDDNAFQLKELVKKGANQSLPQISYEKDRVSAIFYSGGSTGNPKGICLSDFNMNSLAIQTANGVGHPIPGTKFLSAMPLFHGFGLGVGIHTFMNCGAQCILVPQFTLDAYVSTLLKEKTNMLAIVPSMLEAFLHTDAFDGKDLSFLQGLFCGADAAPQKLQERMNAFLKEHNCSEVVREGYGLTETVTCCALNPIDKVKFGSVGLPLGETEMRIVKPGTFEDVPLGENGELIINGPSVMLGYLDEPEETANTLKEDKDGRIWLFTGDMCKMDEDGYVFFVQRIKRMIITNGYNVYPTQVEEIIRECSEVENVCVVGVKDKLSGQRVVACVVLKDGADKKTARDNIMNKCKESIEEFAVPSKIEFIDEIPLTKMGKTNFTQLEKEMNEKKRGSK
ncbi:MAG: acyl--CoA ligase [Ruminococcaceae bacterium]|nr:acyl--CoA ligase [Oscillospiraceae bacterium]